MAPNSIHIYSGDLRDRATSRDNLNTRLILNRQYQSVDFQDWLLRRLDVVRGEHILDVGCGTGAQSLRFLEAIGNRGTVSALDISETSVAELQILAAADPRLTAVTSDMSELNQVIQHQFRQKTYTLAHSSYALYYSPARLSVLEAMANSLETTGRVAIFTPSTPHGLVDLAMRYSQVPSPVLESLEFGATVLEPTIRRLFWDVTIHYFQSEMRVTSLGDFMSFYRATTYFDVNAEPSVQEYAANEIKTAGAVTYQKNGYLIIGRDRR